MIAQLDGQPLNFIYFLQDKDNRDRKAFPFLMETDDEIQRNFTYIKKIHVSNRLTKVFKFWSQQAQHNHRRPKTSPKTLFLYDKFPAI